MKSFLFMWLLSCGLLHNGLATAQEAYATGKPWTFWWWMGSAVEKPEITRQLEAFARAGIGGVSVVPIYGVRGFEAGYRSFLGSDWLDAFSYTVAEAGRLRLGVDVTLGTGWPYGGPWIGEGHAAKKLVVGKVQRISGERLQAKVDSLLLAMTAGVTAVYVMTEKDTFRLTGDPSSWTGQLPSGHFNALVFGVTGTRQQVKRAAPGGEGLVMDYFDTLAFAQYVHPFEKAFQSGGMRGNRAFYHDSYEVYGADWTADFHRHFRLLRGYDLLDHLPLLTDTLHPSRPGLVCDVRETISDLLVDGFGRRWTSWCSQNDRLTRLQAHGAPANLLDFYALADIPETESFGCSLFSIPGLSCDTDYEPERFGRPSPLMMKFASSPAHLLGKKLVSSETGTWLGNHFKVSLQQVKPQVDELFVSGINHIFFHGITYSPHREAYPGWLFYASTNFGPSSHFWPELPLLNKYILNVQEVLQDAESANDILLYFPIHDLWSRHPGALPVLLDVHHHDEWFGDTPFGELARRLWDAGYTFDYLSDDQLTALVVNDARDLVTPGRSAYKAIVLPPVEYIPLPTLTRLAELAEAGANVIFRQQLPQKAAGFRGWRNQAHVDEAGKRLMKQPTAIVGESVETALERLAIRRERLKEKGLDFIRKKNGQGHVYFIANLADRFFRDTVWLSEQARFAELTDPLTGRRTYKELGATADGSAVLLDLPPGKSVLLQTLMHKPDPSLTPVFDAVDTFRLVEPWRVHLPAQASVRLPSPFLRDSLYSWTNWGIAGLETYTGKIHYSSSFALSRKPGSRDRYTLLIDDVNESAEVLVNGIPCGTIWSLPYELEIPSSALRKRNAIEIVVQNLSANGMIALDRAQHPWKKFHDINIVDIRYRPFDASGWTPLPSGLAGEVKLVHEVAVEETGAGKTRR